MSTSPKTYRIYTMDPIRRIVAADWLEASGERCWQVMRAPDRATGMSQ